MRTSFLGLGLALTCAVAPFVALAQDTSPTIATPTPTAVVNVPSVPGDVVTRIRDEGINRSRAMYTLQTICDRFGARLTGSPAAQKSNEWTRDEMMRYGMRAHLESWGPFGRSWELKKFTAQVSQPLAFPITAFAKAWSSSTKGELDADVVIFNPQSDADYEKAKGKLRGKIVLVSAMRRPELEFEPRATRLNADELKRLKEMKPGTSAPFVLERPASPDATPIFTPIPTATPLATPTPAPTPAGVTPTPTGLAGPRGGRPDFAAQIQRQGRRLNFLRDEGAALLLDISYEGEGGVVFTMSASVAQPIPTATATPLPGRTPRAASTPVSAAPGAQTSAAPGGQAGRLNFPARLSAQDERAKERILPQMTLSTEDYNRLYRMVQSGQKVKMRAQITTKSEAKAPCYNTIGEIPGTDLKDQVVMMGAHMDSWQAGTGAADNAVGCAMVMEAARILRALNLQPRRTIRVALWTGEEQGLLGSAAYVRQHFGRIEGEGDQRKLVQGPEYEKLAAYYNLDNGAGRSRGIFAQSNTAAMPYFSSWLAPFADISGDAVSAANTGSTDHVSFDRIGLPGFQFIQDNLDYFTQNHHSSQDLVDRVPEDDMKQAAIILATLVYQTAMMDERFPRKPFTVQPPRPVSF